MLARNNFNACGQNFEGSIFTATLLTSKDVYQVPNLGPQDLCLQRPGCFRVLHHTSHKAINHISSSDDKCLLRPMMEGSTARDAWQQVLADATTACVPMYSSTGKQRCGHSIVKNPKMKLHTTGHPSQTMWGVKSQNPVSKLRKQDQEDCQPVPNGASWGGARRCPKWWIDWMSEVTDRWAPWQRPLKAPNCLWTIGWASVRE